LKRFGVKLLPFHFRKLILEGSSRKGPIPLTQDSNEGFVRYPERKNMTMLVVTIASWVGEKIQDMIHVSHIMTFQCATCAAAKAID